VESEVLRLDEFLHERDDLLCKLNEVEPDKAFIILHSFDNGVYKVRVFEYLFAPGPAFVVVKVAVKEYHLQKSKHVHLHRILLVINDLSEGLEDGVDDEVCYFVGLFFVLFEGEGLEDELHELAGRSVDGVGLLEQLVIHRLHCLAHNELQSYLHYRQQVLVEEGALLGLGEGLLSTHVVEDLIKRHLYVVCHLPMYHVAYHLVFGVEDDVTELAEVLNDYLRFVVLEEEQLVSYGHEDLRVLEELLQQGIQNSSVVLLRI